MVHGFAPSSSKFTPLVQRMDLREGVDQQSVFLLQCCHELRAVSTYLVEVSGEFQAFSLR
jgi:hypothetical protein